MHATENHQTKIRDSVSKLQAESGKVADSDEKRRKTQRGA